MSELTQSFAQKFGCEPTTVVAAPGRVNLIGEHTDYNEGFCLPIALTQQTNVALAPSNDGKINAFSVNFDTGDTRAIGEQKADSWTDYIVGAYAILAAAGHDRAPCNFAVHSTIPIGGGVSSSAAFCVAVLRGLNQQFALGLDAPTIARLAQKIENDFIGLPCGLMDQMASSVGAPGQPLLFDTMDESTKAYPLIAGTTVLVFNSGVERKLTGSEYSDRRAQCLGAAQAMGVRSLRLADLSLLDQITDAAQTMRARHNITENQRVMTACECLTSGNAQGLGVVLNQGHASMRDDFEASVPAVDTLVEACVDAGALGARITGAGFGGCIVVLCTTETVAVVKAAALAMDGVSMVSEIAA